MQAAAAPATASDFVVLNSAPQGSSALKKFAIGLLILVLVVGALAATAYFLRQQLTDLTGIDLVDFFQRTKEKIGMLDTKTFDAQAININFAPDEDATENYATLKQEYLDQSGDIHCGETCEATSGGVAKWERPEELRGFRYRQACTVDNSGSELGTSFQTATLTRVNTNNALVVKAPSGPGTYELTIEVGDCQFLSHSIPRLELVQEDGESVPLIDEQDATEADMQVTTIVREVRIKGDTFRILDPRMPYPNDAVGTSNEQVWPTAEKILYVFRKDQQSYSVAKTEVADVLSKVQSVLPGSQLAAVQDITDMANSDIANCACGWVNKTTPINAPAEVTQEGLTSGYPSKPGTSEGCGAGARGFINCGDDGPSRAEGNKAGVYIITPFDSRDLSEIKPLLHSLDLDCKILPYYFVVQPTRISRLGVRRIR